MTDRLDQAVLRHSIEMFAGAAFQHLKGQQIEWAPYLFLLLSKLEQARRGEVNRLIITLPPRLLKSFFISTVLPAFILGHRPRTHVMCVSYGRSLADEFAEDRRRLMSSAFYRQVFGDVLKPRSARALLRSREGGTIRAVSMESGVTGKGADFIILDDPQMAQDVRSSLARDKVADIFTNALLTRLDDPSTGCIILVMQRLHEDDLVGRVLGIEGMTWDVLNLPAVAETDEEHEVRLASGSTLFTRKEGDLLHPRRLTQAKLDELKRSSPMLFATQYQQRPAPAGGGLVKEKWFRRYAQADRPDRFDELIQSWDTASTVSEFADWTVCTTWGRLGESIYLLHVHRERLLFPGLVKATLRLAQRFNPDVVLIEDHASGTALIQTLQDQGFGKCRPVKPVGDKEIRMTNQTAVIESGRVWLPADADWVQDYLHELVLFPNARHDDQVDSTSQALDWLNRWYEGKGLFEFMKQEAARARQEAVERPPHSPHLEWWKMKAPDDASEFHCSSGHFRNGEDGFFWIPAPDGRVARSMGFTKLGEYVPPPKLRAWA